MSRTINLEILESATIYADKEIQDLNSKVLVPKMMIRRRLTRAAKIAIYLADKVSFKKGRIVYGSSFGELEATSNILNNIYKQEPISPTAFQNSVYNTAVSYLSILDNNKEEIMTVSSGDETASNCLKVAAVKALDGDTILVLLTETLNIEGIEEVNTCDVHLECGVALKVRYTDQNPTIEHTRLNSDSKIPNSVSQMFAIAQNCQEGKTNIIEVSL